MTTLRTKLRTLGVAIPVLLACAIVAQGAYLINGILLELGRERIGRDLGVAVTAVESTTDVLERAGVSDVANYVELAQEEFLATLEGMETGSGGAYFVLDDMKQLLRRPPDIEGETALGALRNIGTESAPLEIEGVTYYGQAARLEPWGWTLGVVAPTSSIFAARTHYLATVSGITCVILLVSLILSHLLIRQLIHRVDSALVCVDEVQRGNLSSRIEHVGQADEFGTFLRAFNQMIAELELRTGESHAARDELERHRDHLEVAVESRTRELEQQNVELQSAREASDAANEAKGQFLANMSHELRTPMNGILGMTCLILDSELTDEQRSLANTVRTCGDSLLSVISDILDFSKIEAGKLEVERIDFSLGRTLGAVREILAVQASNKGLEFVVEAEEDLPDRLQGDPSRLRQVLINLTTNAIKFTKRGEISVRATRIAETATRTEIRIEVRDSGIGIKPEDQSRLFSSFSQVDASTTRQFGGTGLGLAISKQLTVLMGGNIGAESELGKGATFWVQIPFEKQPGEQEFVRVSTSAEEPAEEPRLKPLRVDGGRREPSVLLVEDNPVNQLVACRILEQRLGCLVETASTGRKALEALAANEYDIVLMDCLMPEMDGYEATRSIRDQSSAVLDHEIPVIALTANAMFGDREKCLEAGMTDYVRKPLDVETLAEVLARNLAA